NEVKVIENFVGRWDDPGTGKVQAEALWTEGVDIIFAAAGKSGLGVLESVENKEKGKKWVIGVDSDQDWMYPGQVLCSMMKRVDLAVYNAVKDVYDDAWTASPDPFTLDIVIMGMTNDPDTNGVGLSPLTYTKDVIGSEKIKEVNETVKNKIINRDIRIPTNETDLETWVDEMGIKTTYKPPISTSEPPTSSSEPSIATSGLRPPPKIGFDQIEILMLIFGAFLMLTIYSKRKC
ncbi:MAG: BMP family protein, partial [Promethearchaeota archaeon]